MLLAVNFHYVQSEGRYRYPGIHPITAQALRCQLEVLGQSFEFVSGHDVLRAVEGIHQLPSQACLLTFDDGLKEQIDYALPILRAMRIPAVFFISTQPLAECRALTVHKTHWLQATLGPDAFLEELKKQAAALGTSLDLSQVDEAAAARQYLYDEASTRRLKFLLNHLLPFSAYERLIDAVFLKHIDERSFCEAWYMSPAQVRMLADEQTIGSHGCAHAPLALLSADQCLKELAGSRRLLEKTAHQPVEMISYPYGGPTAVTREVANLAAQSGYRVGITMERSLNQSLIDPLLLARVSTNDAPGGKSPLLEWKQGAYTVASPLSAYRSRYWDEQASFAPPTPAPVA